MENKYNDLPFMVEYKGAYLTKDDILELYKKLSYDGKVGIENFRVLNNSLYKKKYMIKTLKGSRLATKDEVSKAVYGVYYEKESILDFYKTKYISIILDYITAGKSYETSINKNKLISVYEYMMSDEFISDLPKIKNAPEFDFYNKNVDTSENELMIDVLKEIKKELDPDYGSKYSKIAFNIAKNALKSKCYILSKNQFGIIEVEYNKLKRNNDIAYDILDKARKVKANIVRNSSYCNMIYDIACQAIDKGYLSEKQEKLLVDYFEKELSNKDLDSSQDKVTVKHTEPKTELDSSDEKQKFDELPEFGVGDFDWN